MQADAWPGSREVARAEPLPLPMTPPGAGCARPGAWGSGGRATYSEQLARRRQRRLVRRIAGQGLPHALAQDARLAARGAEHRPHLLLALAVAAHRLEPARAAVERHRA